MCVEVVRVITVVPQHQNTNIVPLVLEPGNGESVIFAGIVMRRNNNLAGYAPSTGWVANPENIVDILQVLLVGLAKGVTNHQ